jgi:hypothetical protein
VANASSGFQDGFSSRQRLYSILALAVERKSPLVDGLKNSQAVGDKMNQKVRQLPIKFALGDPLGGWFRKAVVGCRKTFISFSKESFTTASI